jgi:hypothetical protein
MVTGTSITIETGSTLNIDGGTITSACNDFWEGIYVQGDSESRQDISTNMGRLRIKNGGVVSNAYVGVHNYALKTNGTTDWSSTGGIIWCSSGAQFINNKKDVAFLSYQNTTSTGAPADDRSYFKNTSFITNDQLIDGSTNIMAHVTMYKTDGVQFKGCYFTSNEQYKSVGATGIVAIDADFIVTTYSNTPTEFNNLKKGIEITNYNDYYSVDINNSLFNNTPYGIKMLAVQEASITENEFHIENSDITPFGLYMLECSGYKVEENQFYGGGQLTNSGLGIVIKNKNMEDDNDIYRNEFFDLYIGVLVNGKNGSNDLGNPYGLEILCNRYNLNQPSYFDFALTDKGIVSGYQGNNSSSITDPAGNLFSNQGCQSENSLYVSNDSYSYVYFHHANSETTPQIGCYTQSLVFPANITGIYNSWVDACPSRLESDDGSELPGLKIIAQASSLEIESLSTSYETVIDGGNPALLIQSINSPMETSLSVRMDLISYSPYLSDDVVIAAINRTPSLNHWHLAEVIIANSPVSNSVWSEFEVISTMPDFLYNHVLSYQQQGSVSPRGQLELQIKNQVDIKEQASSNFVRGQMKISDNDLRNQEIIDFYALDDSKLAVRRKVAALVSSGNYSEASIVLSVYDGDVEFDAYATVQEIVISINEGLDSLNVEDITTLYDIANGEKFGKYRAQAILVEKDGAQFDHPIILPDPGEKSLSNKASRRKVEVTPIFASYPNPADDKMYFTIQLPAQLESAFIEIHSMDGKFIKNMDVSTSFGIIELETSDLNSGMYISTLLVNKQQVSSQNFVIQH